jgi:hypothetical protein
MSAVQLRLGDMFDCPSDLIVLPCSTVGTTSSFVFQKLLRYNIPAPRPGMRLGDVDVMQCKVRENIARYVAFAATVEGYWSDASAIRRIGARLGECTRTRASIRTVAAPLLGTGAGLAGEVVLDAITEGFETACHQDATLVVSVLQEGVLHRLERSRAGPGKREPIPRRAFRVEEASVLVPLMEWVLEEAERLRERATGHADSHQVLELIWGDRLQQPGCPDHAEAAAHHAAVLAAEDEVLRMLRAEVAARGIRLPRGGPEHGLLDFPTTWEGRWVCLCWRRGEGRVQAWHEVDEECAARRPVTLEQRTWMGTDVSLPDDSRPDS